MKFLAIALAIVLVGALITVSTFFGYMRLGRRVTMSPVEIAKAFGAPLLEELGSNESVDGLLRASERSGVGKLRYGELLDGDGSGNDEETGSDGLHQRRLQFDKVGNVRKPQAGAGYI
ncbi:hypothetical protein BJ508DRAFT_334174 [Ascobolus immersus RN42]|uniref:Uncharacterized protein n=1 Tax=Ascobolus immersus RN42 TaxID=1160509 RepID=A0A3N4HH03_ASCIM|nr:hypothetical protein BJ508DRAFT_334174 [Ascobolus immersus RN42]